MKIDLSGKQRLYVRSILESVYSSDETDQIISAAARNTISVLDAAVALRVNAEPLQIVVAAAKQRMAPKPVAEKTVRPPNAQERANKPVYVVARPIVLSVSIPNKALIAFAESRQVVSSTASQQLFVSTLS